MRIRRYLPIVIPALIGVTLTAAGCSGGGSNAVAPPRSVGTTGSARPVPDGVPAAARAIMAKPAYRAARWIYQVSDLKTGKVLLANRPGEMAFTASAAKLLTIGTVYDTMGAGTRLTTPVYATGRTNGGVLHGNLALVASGDLTMGGRNAAQGRADDSFTANTIDHVYGDVAPNAALPPGNPLAGLDSLAHQIAASGIHRVDGNVIIDDRLWQTFHGQEGDVQPMYVNDNVLDITVTPGAAGRLATVAGSPRTAAYQVRSEVKTGNGTDVALHVAADPQDPHRLVVTGSIGANAGPRLTIYRIPNPASWARTLFVEALTRAGVTVAADPLATNPASALPAKGSYTAAERVAAFRSPPISAMGSLVLKTSYNTGANAMLCLLAVHEGSTDCLDGLAPIRAVVKKAGLVSDDVVLIDGQGADPASMPPAQMVRFLRWTQSRSWAGVFKAGQPVLGESGSLAGNGIDSPAKGKLAAKTATSAHPEPGTGRVLFNVQRLAGFMTTSEGRKLVFDVAVSGGTYPDVLTGLVQAGNDVADVSAAFQQALSR
jgi:serine-type D-Ala-D-Ala carboxypeptidase/endopeptidase (penicillin-binding protein 4)